MQSNLTFRDHLALNTQRIIDFIALPIAILVTSIFMIVMRYRICNKKELRRQFGILCEQYKSTPVLICLNHLSRLDSIVFLYAFMNPWKYFKHFSWLPWHVLEIRNLKIPLLHTSTYLTKGITVEQMGPRENVHRMMRRVKFLLKNGELVSVFPEGKRSLTGRVDAEGVQYGVGELVRDVTGCKVLCVYLRGEGQGPRTLFPPYASTIDIEFEMIEPKTTFTGLRATRDLALQIIHKIAEMEDHYFARRQ